jgi:FkbM family methyltransferase
MKLGATSLQRDRELTVARQTLTNAASHVRKTAGRYPCLDSAIRFVDTLRHPELRARQAVLADAERIRSDLRRAAGTAAMPEVLLADGETWLKRDLAWFAARLETIPLLFADFEAHESAELARSVRPDGRFVDVGANFGLHSVLLATRFPELHVDAFEPVPQTVELLRANVAKNACARVDVHAVAVSDTEGDLVMTSGLATGNHIVPANGSLVGPESVRVSSIALDGFWKRLGSPPVDTVKVDVEGAEWHVLRGGPGFFGQGPVLLIELVDEWLRRYGHDTAECIDLLRTYGYRFARPIGAGRDGEWSALSDVRSATPGNFLVSRSR